MTMLAGAGAGAGCFQFRTPAKLHAALLVQQHDSTLMAMRESSHTNRQQVLSVAKRSLFTCAMRSENRTKSTSQRHTHEAAISAGAGGGAAGDARGVRDARAAGDVRSARAARAARGARAAGAAAAAGGGTKRQMR